MTPEGSQATRWAQARDHYIALGLHPKVAGHYALASMDGPLPDSLTEASSRLVADQPATVTRTRTIRRRTGGIGHGSGA